MIDSEDVRWGATFPVCITPHDDEWLGGLLVRCDAANGWMSGTTVKLVHGAVSSQMGRAQPHHYVTEDYLNLPLLAQGLGVALDQVTATTWCAELQRCHGNNAIGPWQLGRGLRLRVCPQCIHDRHYLSRDIVCPLQSGCITHGLAWHSTCSCGTPLRLFHHEVPPFTCTHCLRPWANLPHIVLDQGSQQHNQRIHDLYRAVLSVGTPHLINCCIRWVRERRVEQGLPSLFYSSLLSRRVDPYERCRQDITLLVELLIYQQMTATHVRWLHEADSSDAPYCRNHACPRFRDIHNGLLLSYDRPNDESLRYCAECGSISGTNRLYATFDDQCRGNDAIGWYPTPHAIHQLQAERDMCVRHLQRLCRQQWQKPHPKWTRNMLARVGIPKNDMGRFYATRVGLNAVIRDNATRYRRRQRHMISAQDR